MKTQIYTELFKSLKVNYALRNHEEPWHSIKSALYFLCDFWLCYKEYYCTLCQPDRDYIWKTDLIYVLCCSPDLISGLEKQEDFCIKFRI